jgi:hypothetical protein
MGSTSVIAPPPVAGAAAAEVVAYFASHQPDRIFRVV